MADKNTDKQDAINALKRGDGKKYIPTESDTDHKTSILVGKSLSSSMLGKDKAKLCRGISLKTALEVQKGAHDMEKLQTRYNSVSVVYINRLGKIKRPVMELRTIKARCSLILGGEVSETNYGNIRMLSHKVDHCKPGYNHKKPLKDILNSLNIELYYPSGVIFYSNVDIDFNDVRDSALGGCTDN